MRIPSYLLFATACCSGMAGAAAPPEIPLPIAPTYADLADLALTAPIAAGVSIRDATRLKPTDGGTAAPGTARFYVQADVQSLIHGAGGLPGQVSYLADVPLNAKGRAPKLRKARALLMVATVPGRPGEVRLIARQAQLPWNDAIERQLRAILTEASAADAAPRVTGVTSAFSVPGSLPGESETQIFLSTATDRPVSLNVLRRPGEQPSWAVALGEMVDEAAAPPVRDTLLWYRLACTLPADLPAASTADLDEAAAIAARADYRFVLERLGRCTRAFAQP